MKKNVLVYGTFDLFHYGHLNLLKKSKDLAIKYGGKLIVGVNSDRWAKEKGKKTIINEKQRVSIVQAIKYVDETFVNDKKYSDKKEDIIKKNIGAIVIDKKNLNDYIYLKNDCDIVSFKRTNGISTTKIKNRIKNGK